MNITPFTIYLISRLTPLHEFFTTIIILSVIAMVVCAIAIIAVGIDGDWGDHAPRVVRRFFVWILYAFLFFGACTVVVPTTKDAAAMIVIPRIANSQTVHELGESVVGLAKAWCDELKPGNKDGGKK